MAGERSDRTADAATADQPPTEGEPTYRPDGDRGGDRPGSEHEEPIDGPEPDPYTGPEAEPVPRDDGGRGGRTP